MIANTQSDNIIAFGGNTMVYESVKRFSLKGLNDLIRVLMENIDDSLFDLAEKVDNDHERGMYFEAMRDIRLKRKQIVEAFDTEMQACFDRLILNKSLGHEPQDLEELSLVDHSVIEDEIAIDNMVSKARPNFEDELFAVDERLKTVLHRKEIKSDQNPFDPKAICESFHKASSSLDTDIKVKLIFYKLFDKFVMSNLGGFYRELNDFFIQKGVLPHFDASQERQKQTSKFMANRITRSSQQRHSDTSDVTPELGVTDSGADIQNSNDVGGGMIAMLRQLLSPAGVSPAVPGTASPVTGGNAGGIARRGHSGAASGDAGSNSSAVVVPMPFMPALTSMQTSSVFSQPLETSDPHQLQSSIHRQLVDFKQQNSQHTSAADNQIIDIVSMLFDFFFDDEALPDPIKVLIGRLQIPILKVAMLDGSFFNHKKHPARKLLDTISKAAMGWGSDADREKLLIDKLEATVDYLLAEFEEDLSVFEKALADFQQFIDSENEKIERNQQQLEQQEQAREQKVAEAQKAADDVINKLLGKYEFSFGVIDYLEGVWNSVLFNTYLTQGRESSHWKNLKKISSTLIWTLIPKNTEDEKAKLLKTLPPLLRALAKGMDLVNIDNEQQNRIFQMLMKEHATTVKKTSKNIVTRVDDTTVWPEDKMAAALAGFNNGEAIGDQVDLLLTEDETGEIRIVDTAESDDYETDEVAEITRTNTNDVIHNLKEFTDCIVNGDIYIDEEIVMDSTESVEFHQQAQQSEDADEFLQKAQALEIGDWVEFAEPGEKPLNAKLSWKSNITGKYVFVNRQGHKVKNMTVYGLATQLKSGHAKCIESVSVFDRAINSFMSGVRH